MRKSVIVTGLSVIFLLSFAFGMLFFISENGKSRGYKLSVFNRPIVTLSLNLEF